MRESTRKQPNTLPALSSAVGRSRDAISLPKASDNHRDDALKLGRARGLVASWARRLRRAKDGSRNEAGDDEDGFVNRNKLNQQPLSAEQQAYALSLGRILDTKIDSDEPGSPASMARFTLPPQGFLDPNLSRSIRQTSSTASPTRSNQNRRATHALNPTHDLDMTLSNPITLAALSQFAAHEFCVENILFLAAAEEFYTRVTLCSKSPPSMPISRNTAPNQQQTSQIPGDDRVAWARAVVDSFVEAGSPNEVNLPSSVRTVVEDTLRKASEAAGRRANAEPLPADMFAEAVEHVKHMLATDIMPRYRRSRFYVDQDPAV
ncbi:hypothetical protein HKX48_006673 [Thoreauomyces humboldtii]|nr:hypothetical protein HKX48_006673 [Thoreauomyces humboldtii]